MTSVACWSTVCGMVRPRAAAVLRLITKSKTVGCSTGRSAGLAPCRILLTKMAAVGGLAVYGFVVSLGGRRLFQAGFLDD